MDIKTYEIITSKLRSYQHGTQILKGVNWLATTLVYCTYPVFLLLLAIKRDLVFWRMLLTPGISFMLLSVLRNHINAPRPYEVFQMEPIIAKDTQGKSFPSRHVFSVFVIATSLYHVSNQMGIFLMVIGVILAIVRVVGGVHFPRDVIAGGIIGILLGILGFYL